MAPPARPDRPASSPGRRPLGLVALTALVIGNMVGSGVFLLPASLAPFGGVSVLGWGVSAGGSILLALVLARLARRHAEVGGPYAYVREAFGEFPAFLAGWGYWISCWVAQAGLATAMVTYLGALVPGAREHSMGIALSAIVLLAGVNVLGVKEAGSVQVVTTILKLLPLVAIALFGLARFEPERLEPFNPTGQPLWSAVQGCLALTLWAFLGFESASVAGGQARDGERDVPRATLLGIGAVTVLYVTSTVAVMGLVPRAALTAPDAAPFADAARLLWGPGAAALVAAGASISCFGALNGWILVAGQMPVAIARDGLFPGFFGRLGARGTPANGLVLSSALACILVVANYSSSTSRVAIFTGLTLLSTLSALVPLVFCAMADVALTLRWRRPRERVWPALAIALGGFAYGLLAVGGAGEEYVYWGFLLQLAGVPVFVWAGARR